MAAVAAEPGAAAPTITTGAAEEEGGPEPGPVAPVGPVSPVVSVVPGKPEAPLQSDGTLSNVNPACKQPAAREQRGDRAPVLPELPELPELPGPDQLINNLPVLPGPDQLINNFPVSRSGPGVPGSSLQDPQPSAVFLLSPPVTVPVPEAGLSLDEPAEPTDRDRDYTELRPGPDPEGLQDSSPGEGGPGPGPVQNLNLGSEVRVCLDHVIDDALVVSFRLGEKVFSGVLMDVTRRFGPYGIPITVFPRRDRPSLQSDSIKQEEVTVSPPPPPPPSQSWTSKPPPLFQEGAPYPPPLLIRDTYNQALPQPPPRKIKRPKRRYRSEEPTSIMNAIKLRPRQVLCDKCKGVVASGGHREARRGPVDLRGEEASRRRRSADGPISSEVKRLRSDDKGSRGAASSGIRVTSSSHRVLRGVASSPATSSGRVRLKLNSKKVLTKGSTDRSKARQVLKKLARSSQPPSHRRPKDQNQNQNLDQSQDQSQNQDRTKAVTRAAALQNHNQKVHFTRRLQQLGGAAVGLNSALPPRMRLKPQRYRTDEGQVPPPSSSPSSSPPLSPPKQSARSSPPKPSSPTLSPVHDAPPPSPPPPPCCATSVAMETQEVQSAEEELGEQEAGGGAGQVVVELPPPSSSSCSSSLDSSTSQCSFTETSDPPPPPGDPPSSPCAPPPSSSSAPHCPAPSSPVPPHPGAVEEEPRVGREEEDEEGGDPKRRRKSSTSSSSSSCSSSSSVFSKTVSKCSLPDGRTVCVGDIVWAKIYGFPWWPARVLGITVARRGDTGLAVRQEARVSWFGSPTTSFLPLSQLSPFLESFQSRFDRKRKGPYRRAIAEAASAAKQLTPEVRALLTQFET